MGTREDEERRTAEAAQDAARKDQAATASARLEGLREAATYTVQPGDTFESIAGAVYGDEDQGAAIYDASVSSGAIGTDRRQALAPGVVLTLPVVAAGGETAETAEAADEPDDKREPVTAGGREGGVHPPADDQDGAGDQP